MTTAAGLYVFLQHYHNAAGGSSESICGPEIRMPKCGSPVNSFDSHTHTLYVSGREAPTRVYMKIPVGRTPARSRDRSQTQVASGSVWSRPKDAAYSPTAATSGVPQPIGVSSRTRKVRSCVRAARDREGGWQGH